MKTIAAFLFVTFLTTSLSLAAPKIRWPRDVVEWDKLAEAKKVAAKEGKGFLFIFVPREWSDDKDEGVVNSIEAANDAISSCKSFCLVVKGDYQAVAQADEDSDVPKALGFGLNAAGNAYPLVVILDTEMKVVLGATNGNTIHSGDGKKIFREAKKKARELAETREKEKK